jgi:hypothetical protein
MAHPAEVTGVDCFDLHGEITRLRLAEEGHFCSTLQNRSVDKAADGRHRGE